MFHTVLLCKYPILLWHYPFLIYFSLALLLSIQTLFPLQSHHHMFYWPIFPQQLHKSHNLLPPKYNPYFPSIVHGLSVNIYGACFFLSLPTCPELGSVLLIPFLPDWLSHASIVKQQSCHYFRDLWIFCVLIIWVLFHILLSVHVMQHAIRPSILAHSLNIPAGSNFILLQSCINAMF